MTAVSAAVAQRKRIEATQTSRGQATCSITSQASSVNFLRAVGGDIQLDSRVRTVSRRRSRFQQRAKLQACLALVYASISQFQRRIDSRTSRARTASAGFVHEGWHFEACCWSISIRACQGRQFPPVVTPNAEPSQGCYRLTWPLSLRRRHCCCTGTSIRWTSGDGYECSAPLGFTD